MPEVNNFVYSNKIQEIKPLVLNLTISKNPNGENIGELRKVFLIRNENKEFWKEFFAASLQGIPIKAEVLIEFRNPGISATKLKSWGLLKEGITIKL